MNAAQRRVFRRAVGRVLGRPVRVAGLYEARVEGLRNPIGYEGSGVVSVGGVTPAGFLGRRVVRLDRLRVLVEPAS